LNKRALITGVTGQDGAYLALLLCAKGYDVVGTSRKSVVDAHWRLAELGLEKFSNFVLVDLDVTDLESCKQILLETKPDELYNLAAQSSVVRSFEDPYFTHQVNSTGALNVLEAIRQINPEIRYLQPGSSEMFGDPGAKRITESSFFFPSSPYGSAKLDAYFHAINYRNSFNLFAANALLLNHESPLRGPDFVTRKISIAVARIALGSDQPLTLGALDSSRDWGYAPEYVEGMWRILQHSNPDDFVLATGKHDPVGEFARQCFLQVGIDIVYEGSGADMIGLCSKSGRTLVKVDPQFIRARDSPQIVGDYSRAEENLGWSPSFGIKDIAQVMVTADLSRLGEE